MRDGDPSPDGAGPLVSARGIEIGHIFQLGRKYTDAFEADVLGENGKPVRLTMGSYGIGVSRLVAVIAEQHHDELGLRWPSSVSPFDVHVVIANKDDAARAGAEALAAELDGRGVELLLDDRKASPGIKFKDAELLGVPWIVVVGRGWADGVVELRNRFTGETREIPVDNAAADIATALTSSADRSRRRSRIGRNRAAMLVRGLALFGAAGEGDGDRGSAQNAAPPGGPDRTMRQRASPRTLAPARRSPARDGSPRDGGVLFHPHREIGRIRGVVDLDRQLIAGGGQRWRRQTGRPASRRPPRAVCGARPSMTRPGRSCRASNAPTRAHSRRWWRARSRSRRTARHRRHSAAATGWSVRRPATTSLSLSWRVSVPARGRSLRRPRRNQRDGVRRGAGRRDRAEQAGAITGECCGQLCGAVRRRAQRSDDVFRGRRLRRLGRRARRGRGRRVLAAILTSSSDSAWACADRSDATAFSACHCRRAADAAASVASWLSARARSSCAASSSTSGGGVDDPHAVAVAPSSAMAAADKDASPADGRVGARHEQHPAIATVVYTRSRLCIRWAGQRVCRLPRWPWRIVEVGSKSRRAEPCPDNSR